MKKTIFALTLLGANGPGLAGVSVDGMPLDTATVQRIEQRLGRPLPRGDYRVNSSSGCWSSSSGSSGCVDSKTRNYYQKRLQQYRDGSLR